MHVTLRCMTSGTRIAFGSAWVVCCGHFRVSPRHPIGNFGELGGNVVLLFCGIYEIFFYHHTIMFADSCTIFAACFVSLLVYVSALGASSSCTMDKSAAAAYVASTAAGSPVVVFSKTYCKDLNGCWRLLFPCLLISVD